VLGGYAAALVAVGVHHEDLAMIRAAARALRAGR
jgi:hypothetical protein